MKDFKCQYAIKYKKKKITDSKYIFIPVELLVGEETESGFKNKNGKVYPYIYDEINDDYTYFADMVYADDELSFIYGYDGDDLEFIGNYFYNDYKDTVMLVDINDVNESGILYRNMLNLRVINEDEATAIYYMDNSIPNVVLNEKAIREIKDAKTLKDVKLVLTKYQRGLESIKSHRDQDVTRISITGNKINYFETTKEINIEELEEHEEETTNNGVEINSDISYQGLRDYIKERIFGHESEIDTFAQKLYMNYTALKGETVESILFVGPTGTGKTETVRAACDYLNIPMFDINASNLIAAGYVGTSIEDVIIGLYERSGANIEKAQRGLIFLDEFDKLSDVASGETKGPVKNILLTFTAGGTFPVSTNHYSFIFDSSMTNKVYAGVFDRVTDKQNSFGFGAATKRTIETLRTDEELRKKIIEKKYYTQEELTRISTILLYDDLSRETKKDILLHSKLSEYVKKRDRYKRQFGIDLVLDDDLIDAVLDKLSSNSTGMRSVNNFFKKTIDNAERTILENNNNTYKKLILTRDIVDDPNKFDLTN